MKKHLFKTLAISLALIITTALPANAMTTDEIINAWSDAVPLSVDPINSDYLKISGTEGQSVQEVLDKTQAIVASTGIINPFDFRTSYYPDYKYGCISTSYAENALSKYNYCLDWLKENMPLICPTGTPMTEVVPRCARWICDNLTYDDAALGTDKSCEYQSAYTAFDGTGLGVCATYSSAFVAMVSYVPIETDTSYVNWDTENVWYFETGQYMGNGHSWSTIKDPVTGVWEQYDLSSYDTTGSDEYIKISPQTLSSWDAYSGATFCPTISLRKAAA